MLLDKNTVRLLRIPFSFFLMPLFLFALSQAEAVKPGKALLAFLIIHLLVYPASNGYNSYVDRDEGSIGGLKRPPLPTLKLFYVTLMLDVLAIILAGAFVGLYFAVCLVCYIAASRAYSSRLIRLKQYPYIGFLVVVIFQGAFTYYMSTVGITGAAMPLNQETVFVLLGCSFQIAGAYPLTQIYQHEQDLKDGVTTLSYKLGYRGTFIFTAAMFLLCNVCYFLYFKEKSLGMIFYVIQIFFLPIVVYFGRWFYLVSRSPVHANFENTMRMNWIAGVCMNGCFIVLILIRYFPLSYLTAIETAVPDHCYSQQTLTAFYMNSTDDETARRKIKVIAGRTGIAQRYSVIGDFKEAPENYTFFEKNATLLPEPSLSRRMEWFQSHATTLSVRAIRKIENFESRKNHITHLITVTCTGLSAPGLDIELIRELGLNPAIHRSSVNFMGCNAAIVAMKQADFICRSSTNANVLIVCTELCTLHFQKRYNEDYILSNLLFGDGAAAVMMSSSRPDTPHVLEINAFNSFIVHNGYAEMAWNLSESGFIMNLSSYIPDLISENIRPMFKSLRLDPDAFRYWAIHPGGKKIIDNFADALDLDKCKMSSSYHVLQQYGNMSSPTVLFVLKETIDNLKNPQTNDRGFAAAFGPGLSIETMQFSYV
jgi:predicted naringenin-chalcone synthase/4-hydroxybenzoate polyprenyltransferase